MPAGIVFVHGFLSSASVWSRFLTLVETDNELVGVDPYLFSYRSPAVSLHPLRRTPDLNTVADSLRGFLSRDLSSYTSLALVSHSQGGLVAQRSLVRILADGGEAELVRIRMLVMYACPNAGSGLALPLRRRLWFWANPQERELRPLNDVVTETQRIVLNRVVRGSRPLPVIAYAGESDDVVPPVSARSVFPDALVLPGDHFSIVQPDSHTHRSYVALKHDLKRHGLIEPMDTTGVAASHRGQTAADALSPPAPVPEQRRDVDASLGPTSRDGLIVDRLLAVPGMTDPSFLRRLYQQLPDDVRQQLPHHDAPRIELVGVVTVLHEYRHLGSWEALVGGLRSLVRNHPAVGEVAAVLAEFGLVNR